MTPAKPEGIDPKYLKVFYLPPEGSLSRRDLLFGPLTPRYDIVPAVEAEACAAWKGCAQCLPACPQQAIAINGAAATIDKAKCVGCGTCLPVCPVGAIRQPLLNPERLEEELKRLLARGEAPPGPRILFLVADGGPPLDETTGSRCLRLPSIGAVSAWLLLRALTLGADGIVILSCPSGCRHRCDQARWDRTLRFTRELLTRFGVEADRLLVVQREEAEDPRRVETFCEAVAALGSHPLKKLGALKGSETLTLAALLKHLVVLGPEPPAPLFDPAVPFGTVGVKAGRCTLCGACPERCPTGALRLLEDGDSSRLLFDHGRCVACEACVQVCPEAAVEMTRGLVFARLSGETILAEDQMARCQRCGTSIAPQRMLRKIQRSLNQTMARGGEALGRYCPSCQMLQSLAGVRG